MTMPASALDIARERFGYAGLLPGQEDAIEGVLEGRDTLVVMPTGSGKSAIYQIPALLLDRPTVVVSPLIALQRDQVDALSESGTDAASVSSALTPAQRDETLARLRAGDVRYLFVAPEQFANEETMEELRRMKPGLFVVDEAHCISAWGHDFRPDYMEVGAAAEALGRPPILALTATASPLVREEILERLAMRDPLVLVRGFDRPNIRLSVERFADERSKRDALLDRVGDAATPGIVYVATRKTAEDLAGRLWGRGVSAVYYHGGMTASEREKAQEAFMEGAFDVVVATTAFGMGIDKADVRFVFHYDVPDSVDSLYQEIGRAGRDGEPAEARLFFRAEDLGLRRFFAGSAADDARARLHQSRVDMMRGYAETRDCRRQFLLNYFGEPFEDPCDACDNCEAGTIVQEEAEPPFELNSRVTHDSWGPGIVVRYEGDKVVVLFDEEGYRTLSVKLVRERQLLRPTR